MDSQIKQRWITALRTGEYAQGTGTLKFEEIAQLIEEEF